jgi:hypothetical protein
MKVQTPIITLVVGLVVAGTFVGMSVAAKDQKDARNTAASNAAPASATPSAGASAGASSGAPSQPPGEGNAAGGAQPSGAASAPKRIQEPPARAAAPTTFAGKVNGGGASIAISVRNGRTLAYLCDGKKLESWLQGSASSVGQLSLTGAGASLSGGYADGWASGTVSADGKQWSFRIKLAQAPSGLYRVAQRVANAQVVGGWIVDGPETTGLITSNGVTMPAPPIDPATGNVTINGTTVTAAPADPAG